jgi:hypothetical protein
VRGTTYDAMDAPACLVCGDYPPRDRRCAFLMYVIAADRSYVATFKNEGGLVPGKVPRACVRPLTRL